MGREGMLTSSEMKTNSIHFSQVRVIIKGMEVHPLKVNNIMD